MKRIHKILLIVIGLVLLGIASYFIYSKYFPRVKIASEMSPIVALIQQDLVDPSTKKPSHVVVKFYSGDQEVSDYYAIPLENIGRDSSGKFAVAIYGQDSDDVRYVAEVVESSALVATSSTQNEYPPFFSNFVAGGDACFSADSTASRARIISCDETSEISIVFEGTADDAENVGIEDALREFEDAGFTVDFGEFSTSSVLTGEAPSKIVDEDTSSEYGLNATPAYHKLLNIEVNTEGPLQYGSR